MRRTRPAAFISDAGTTRDCEGTGDELARKTRGVSFDRNILYAQYAEILRASYLCVLCEFCVQDAETENANLLETLANVCRGLDITPVEVKEALAPEDIEDWRKGAISSDTLTAFAHSLVQRRERDQESALPTTPSRPPASTAARSGCGSPARF